MRLEVGKSYETRKGLKAIPLYIGLKSEFGYDSDGTVALLIFKDGKAFSNDTLQTIRQRLDTK